MEPTKPGEGGCEASAAATPADASAVHSLE
jgi:hypothetical protein